MRQLAYPHYVLFIFFEQLLEKNVVSQVVFSGCLAHYLFIYLNPDNVALVVSRLFLLGELATGALQ